MRKKLAVCLGLILLVLLVTVSVAWWMPPAEPPLRVGMSNAEVRQALGWRKLTDDPDPYSDLLVSFDESPGWMGGEYDYSMDREQGPDWLGNRQSLSAYFDDKGRLQRWEATPLPRTRPPWLDRTMKSVGW